MDSKPIKIQDAFKDDPDRSSALIVNAAKPFNAEPPEKLLLDDYITPNPLFFVRNHMPVPVVTEKVLKNYTLEPRVDMQGLYKNDDASCRLNIQYITHYTMHSNWGCLLC